MHEYMIWIIIWDFYKILLTGVVQWLEIPTRYWMRLMQLILLSLNCCHSFGASTLWWFSIKASNLECPCFLSFFCDATRLFSSRKEKVYYVHLRAPSPSGQNLQTHPIEKEKKARSQREMANEINRQWAGESKKVSFELWTRSIHAV